jgi:hypothetical protein
LALGLGEPAATGKHGGWASDDTKTYEIDKRGKHTHTQPVS